MLVVMLGPPGVGKGTQCGRLVTHLGWQVVSTGAMLRQAIDEGSALGKTAASYMNAGKLVPNQLVIQVVQEELLSRGTGAGWLFDGFPRTIEQAESLRRMLATMGRELDHVILLTADEVELRQRMLQRATIEGRSDDTPETIAERLVTYRQQTRPLIEFYRSRGLLREVDGMGSPDEVFARILAALPPDAATGTG